MKKLLPALLALAGCLSGHAQAPAIQWEKTLGGSGTDLAYCIRQTADGGYILVGETNSTNGDITGNNGTTDFWVAKLDASGALQWQKALGGSGDDRGYAVSPTSDGGYIVAGATNSQDGNVTGLKGLYDFWVVKLTSTGTITWQKCYGGNNIDEAKSVQQTADGGYIVAGWARSNNLDITVNNGGSDFWVIKLDAAGALTWQKTMGGSSDDNANSVQQTADGGYIVAGETISTGGDVSGNNGGTDYWVVKLTSTGTITWQKCYGGSAIDKAKSIVQTTDGGYMVAGKVASTNGNVTQNFGLENPWLVKISSTGTIEWQKCYGGMYYDDANGVQQTADGGYVFAGNVSSNNNDVSGNHGGDDMWVVKVNSTGTLQWQKCLGGSSSDIAYAVQQTSDNGYVIAGKSNSTNGDRTTSQGLNDYWVVKLVGTPTSTSNPSTGLSTQEALSQLIIYPNPASDRLTIRYAVSEPATVLITDLHGALICSAPAGPEQTELELSQAARGLYFLQIRTSEGVTIASQKIILK